MFPNKQLTRLCSAVLGALFRADGSVSKMSTHQRAFASPSVLYANLTQRTHLRVKHQEMLRQRNLERIIGHSEKRLVDTCTQKSPDLDWLNYFFSLAQNVSDTMMSSLWAQALVCELSQPGSIAKRTLRFLYDSEKWEILAFKKVSEFAFWGDNGHPFIFLSNERCCDQKQVFDEYRLLHQCVNSGLVAAAATPLTANFVFMYLDRPRQICVNTPAIGALEFSYQAFTRTGSDLCKIMAVEPGAAAAESQRRQNEVWQRLDEFLTIADAPTSERVSA